MLENYITYLNFLSQKFDKFFESQKPYICCKKGCGKCCQNAQFPYSQIEFEYLMRGTLYLDIKTKEAIVNNIKTTLEAKKIFEGKKFLYDCPFLIDNVCAVYDYRGIVCRSFGLPTVGENGKIKAPFCCFQGLNYSNVLEDGGNTISVEKFKKLGVKEEPVAFNISYEFLTDPDFERGFNFSFGEKKPLIDWFEELEKVRNEQDNDGVPVA